MISLLEIIYMLIVTGIIGFIFMDIIFPRRDMFFYKKRFDWKQFGFATLVAAPGVIFHELAHKFVAMAFGYQASFSVFWFGLFIGVFLKLIKSPFLIIAPGYVKIFAANIAPLKSAAIAFAGPFVNLCLWLGSWIVLSKATNLKRNTAVVLYLTKQINMILFIFNMIPIPPFDGGKVVLGLIKAIF